MKKTAIIISALLLSGVFVSLGNASEHERQNKKEYYEHNEKYEHNERYENEFYGTVEQIPDGITGTWIISGKRVQVNSDTYIEKEYGKPGVGSSVEVEGRYIDNVFTARKIEVKGRRK